MFDNLRSMKPAVLVTKRIFPEAIAFLKEHAELDYAESDDGLSAEELAVRIRGKQAVVSQLMNKFTPEVLATLEGIRVIANVAVGYDNVDVSEQPPTQEEEQEKEEHGENPKTRNGKPD